MRFINGLVLSESSILRCTAFFYLYVMQGIPAGFSLTAIANYLIAEGQTAQTAGKFVAIVGLPWAFQCIWGPFIDRYQQSAMGKRRPWVLCSQILAFVASLSLLLVNNATVQIYWLSGAFFVHSLFASIQDASVDAMAISVTPVAERGRVNACMRGGMLIGTSLGAAGMAYCIRTMGFQMAALLHSAVLLFFTVFTFFIRENKNDAFFSRRKSVQPVLVTEDLLTIRSLFKSLVQALISSLSLRIFGAIAIVYTCLSIFIRAFNVHLIQELRWTDLQVSTLSSSYVAAGTLLVIGIGGIIADSIGARKLLVVVMLIISVYLVVFNLLSPIWENVAVPTVGLLIWYTFDPGFSIAAMPMLMNICRRSIEGSQFTTYMSMVNFCDVIGAYIAGYAILWLPVPTLGLLCGLTIASVLLFIFFIRYKRKNTVA